VIVAADVLAETNECGATVPMVDQIEETFGCKPKQLLADSNHGTGANLEKLEKAGVEAYIPVEVHETPASVRRDQHQERREAMRARLVSAEGKVADRRRAPVVEGTFGVLKSVLGGVLRRGGDTTARCFAGKRDQGNISPEFSSSRRHPQPAAREADLNGKPPRGTAFSPCK